MKTKKILSLLLALVMLFCTTFTASANNTQEADIYNIISKGIASSDSYIQNELQTFHQNSGVTYGFEWYISTLLRAKKDIDEAILNEYFESIASTISEWTSETKVTDIERTILALTAMEKDITNINGVNVSELIYNNEKLAGGSNKLAYALLALDSCKLEVPETAIWTREAIITELLSFQSTDGSFGLYDSSEGDTDMTAICLQALAPYKSDETVLTAIENALAFLKNTISADYSYNNNSNTTAQVLLALASLGIDVTDSENGFGDANCNIITALEAYKNPDGNGYVFDDTVNSMATIQVMQAYDAYRKAHKEGILYWDFTAVGADYDDTASDDNTPEDDSTQKAEPAVIYVTIASSGTVVKDKNGNFMAQAPVTITDNDEDGKLTVDEALYSAHEAYFEGGATEGYTSYTSSYGLSLARLWGNGSLGTPTSAGYWLNNASCWSLADEVKEGDYLTAFNYYDTTSWSDVYSYFTQNEVSVDSGNTVSLELKYQSGYDENWAPIFSVCPDANVIFLGNDNQEILTTDSDGKISITIDSATPTGNYYVMAYKNDNSIVPAVCKINVTKKTPAPRPSGGGGSIASYTVKFETNGANAISSQKINRNDCVSIPQSPIKDGYSFDGWYLDETLENAYDFNDKVTSSFTLYAKWVAVSEEKQDTVIFNDVSSDDWYYESVKYVYESQLMQGTDNGFEPDGTMTRAMLVTILWRMEKEPVSDYTVSFNDVNTGAWYEDAVKWAASKDIVLGIDDDTFGADNLVSREQTATILYRYAQQKQLDTSEEITLSFSDWQNICEYAVPAMKWAVSTGIIEGKSQNMICPHESTTRAEAATILMRFCDNIVK